MATFGNLIDTIKRDLGADVNSLLDDEIKDAINFAIQDHESERFTFNEGESQFSTVALQGDYDLTTLAPEALTFDNVQYLFADHLYRLEQQSYEWYVEALVNQTAQTGPSNYYAIFDRKMYLYPQPDSVTTVTISGVKRLLPSPLVNDSDTNAWMNQGRQLIRAKAKADLFGNRLYNMKLAATMLQAEQQFLILLRGDRDRFLMSDVVKPRSTF